MISIADAVSEIVAATPYLEEQLAKGVINYSALARQIQPDIEKRLYKTVNRTAVVMALKRMADTIEKSFVTTDISKIICDLTVRSQLIEYTYLNSHTLPEKVRILLTLVEKNRDVFCSVSQSVRETTIIASNSIDTNIRSIFANEKVISQFKDLSSITVRQSEDTVKVPGVYYNILKIIAMEGINLVEVVSTYTELTMIFAKDDANKAFAVLSRYYHL